MLGDECVLNGDPPHVVTMFEAEESLKSSFNTSNSSSDGTYPRSQGAPTVSGCPYADIVDDGAQDAAAVVIVDPADRSYVESLSPGAERDAVVASLVRHRKPEAVRSGDPLPAVTVRRADDLESVELAELVRGRPLLLVFGSFT